jgi:hypothetical protein
MTLMRLTLRYLYWFTMMNEFYSIRLIPYLGLHDHYLKLGIQTFEHNIVYNWHDGEVDLILFCYGWVALQ